jgi:hypothetical protein
MLAASDRFLVLTQECGRADQSKIFFVVPPQSQLRPSKNPLHLLPQL